MHDSIIISLQNVSLELGERRVLDDVNFGVRQGKTKAVLGPSGAGKSTLLKMILGLVKPDTGSVRVDGREITRLRKKELNRIRREIGMVFQGNALFDSLTVAENITFFLREKGVHDERILKDVVRDQLECCNLGEVESFMPEELSGGMRKRVAIARALAFGPKILLYDDPRPASTRSMHG